MPNELTPKQAVQVLDQVAELVTLNRADHRKVQEALAVLNNYIEENEGADESIDPEPTEE